MWGCLSLARRCDCRQPWSAARRREMDRCTAWCRLPAHRRLLIHLMNQHRHRRSSVCRNMCVTADPQALGSFGDGDVGVASAQLQQRLSVDTNGLCATLREVLGDDRYESLTAIPRPQPTRLQLPNRKRRPLAGACGDRRASAKRRQSQSDSPRCLRPTVRPHGRDVALRPTDAARPVQVSTSPSLSGGCKEAWDAKNALWIRRAGRKFVWLSTPPIHPGGDAT